MYRNLLIAVLIISFIGILYYFFNFFNNSLSDNYTYVDSSDVKAILAKLDKDTVDYYINIFQKLVEYENLAKIAGKENLLIKEEYNYYDYNSSDFDKSVLPFSLEMFKEAKVDFPEIHYIIFFKETSFCRGFYNNNRSVSLCSHELIEVLGFNPYNGSGMKYPSHRVKVGKCTAAGSIGMITTKNCNSKAGKGSYCLPKGYERFYSDPHAVYSTPMDHCVDIRLWQEYWYEKKGYKPRTVEEYIKFLEDVGYNPYDHYYHNKTSGLITLYKMYMDKEFNKKYDKYYNERIRDSIDNFYY